jgi:hypothetical protein
VDWFIVFYVEVMDVFEATWLLMYIEIGNSLSFPLEVVYMGSGTHIKSVLYK